MGMFLIVFGIMLGLVALMAIGVLLGRKPISGSCGGMSALGMEVACDICGGDPQRCDGGESEPRLGADERPKRPMVQIAQPAQSAQSAQLAQSEPGR